MLCFAKYALPVKSPKFFDLEKIRAVFDVPALANKFAATFAKKINSL